LDALKQTKARRKGAEHMKIVGCDLHTRYQQIAMLDEETGELVERRLEHENGEALAFYRALTGPVRVGIEATGHTRWFERMLRELGHELWIGDAARMRATPPTCWICCCMDAFRASGGRRWQNGICGS
jgi:hypothetical protein